MPTSRSRRADRLRSHALIALLVVGALCLWGFAVAVLVFGLRPTWVH